MSSNQQDELFTTGVSPFVSSFIHLTHIRPPPDGRVDGIRGGRAHPLRAHRPLEPARPLGLRPVETRPYRYQQLHLLAGPHGLSLRFAKKTRVQSGRTFSLP